jgi:chemotaxis protein CheX
MHLDDEIIRQVTENVWTTTLGLEVSAAQSRAEGSEQPDFLTACVHIVGAWEGAAAIRCSLQLARQAACIMFACDEPQPDDLRDALSELVNMTGGNLKALLPGPCSLSLPVIIDGKDYRLAVPGTQLLNRVLLECHGEPLEVLVMKRLAPGCKSEDVLCA